MSEYYGNLRTELLDVCLRPFGRCLDVGCGEGTTGGYLLESGGASEVIGIEVVDEVAIRAKERLTDVVVMDLNRQPLSDLSIWGKFDSILLGDVLEHLVAPADFLNFAVNELLDIGGQVLISVPNVQSLEVLLPLVLGDFKYKDSGILDRTHLRFFTHRSVVRMIEEAGLEVRKSNVVRPTLANSLATSALRMFGPFSVRQYLLGCQLSGGA